MKARFIVRNEGDLEKVGDEPILASLHMQGYSRRERIRRRLVTQDRYRRSMIEDRNDAPIPPIPVKLGIYMPQAVAALLNQEPVSRSIAEAHSWNLEDRSSNVELKAEDSLTMRRRPVAQSTDCV